MTTGPRFLGSAEAHAPSVPRWAQDGYATLLLSTEPTTEGHSIDHPTVDESGDDLFLGGSDAMEVRGPGPGGTLDLEAFGQRMLDQVNERMDSEITATLSKSDSQIVAISIQFQA